MAGGKGKRPNEAGTTRDERKAKRARVIDASGLDSIFAGGRDPTHAELMEYARYMGAIGGKEYVEMLGTAFMSNADAVAYWNYRNRQPGWGSNTPDP
jgi:hypothetical protein